MGERGGWGASMSGWNTWANIPGTAASEKLRAITLNDREVAVRQAALQALARDLEDASVTFLLAQVMDARADLARPLPVFLKIAPDLADDELAELAQVAQEAGVDAIIATNTTLSRDGLQSRHRTEAGGLSGKPLFERSTRVLARLSQLTEGRLPLIGVGGIDSAETAYAKIRAGASAVQLYSALVYHGFSLVAEIAQGLDALLARDGFDNIAQAVGSGREDWL